jgi:hypothetical protein
MHCVHVPPCPEAGQTDHEAAKVVATHPEQGWSLLCNGVVTFDDNGELLPDGRVVPPRMCAGLALVGSPDMSVGIQEPAFGGQSH